MTSQKNKMNYSRQKARAKVKKIYPFLPKEDVIHHIDMDPFNNDFDNLTIIDKGEHMRMHHEMNWGKRRLKTLEKWLMFYNNYCSA